MKTEYKEEDIRIILETLEAAQSQLTDFLAEARYATEHVVAQGMVNNEQLEKLYKQQDDLSSLLAQIQESIILCKN
jgi:ABC-type transporter Mla subunit MlaD